MFVSFARNGVEPTFGGVAEEVVPRMKEDQLKRIGVIGHALADEKNAAKLGLRRAEVVRDALVARGVPARKLELRSAPAGNLEDCPTTDAGTPVPCVTFALVEGESHELTWNGTRYVAPLSPPPPEPTVSCPPCP